MPTTSGPLVRDSRKRAAVGDWMLLLAAVALFCSSLLVLLPAPTDWLWVMAILVGEWGHYAALGGVLVTVLAFRRRGGIAMSSAAVAGVATVVCLLPIGRAALMARTLPVFCTSAFGGPARDAGSTPFSVLRAFSGTRLPGVQVTEHVYARSGSKELKLDLYRSSQASAPQPLVVLIHGGSWNGGNKNQLPTINRYFATRGYAVAAINYSHAPKSPFPAARDDVFRAIDFMKAQSTPFGIDPTRVVLIGRSAGGQVALSAAYHEREPAIRGVVAFYAPSDLALGYEKPSAQGVLDSGKALRDYIGGTPAEKADVYAAASPINFVTATTPPTLLIHGSLDPIVWPMHSDLLAARLSFARRPHLYLRLPWATHGCDANLSGPSGQLSLYAIDRFLASVFATTGS